MSSLLKEFLSTYEDLLNFEEDIEKIIKDLSLNLVVIKGKKGEGKTYFLNKVSKKLNSQVYDILGLLDKRKKFSDILIIDDFHEILLLENKDVLNVFNKLKNKKVFLSVDPEFLKSDNLKNLFVRKFLSSADLVIDLEKFYKKENIENLVNNFLLFLNSKGISLKEDNKDFLVHFITFKKLVILQIKKLLTYLLKRIEQELVKENKNIDIKAYFHPSIVSSFYWNKEINKSSVDLSIYTEKIKNYKNNTMDLNLITNQFLKSDKNLTLKEIIKSNPELIADNFFIYDFNENLIFKGKSLKEMVKDVKKPDLIGIDNKGLYFIYIFDSIDKLSVKDLENLSKLKDKEVHLVLVTKSSSKNRELLNMAGIKELFDIIVEIDFDNII